MSFTCLFIIFLSHFIQITEYCYFCHFFSFSARTIRFSICPLRFECLFILRWICHFETLFNKHLISLDTQIHLDVAFLLLCCLFIFTHSQFNEHNFTVLFISLVLSSGPLFFGTRFIELITVVFAFDSVFVCSSTLQIIQSFSLSHNLLSLNWIGFHLSQPVQVNVCVCLFGCRFFISCLLCTFNKHIFTLI